MQVRGDLGWAAPPGDRAWEEHLARHGVDAWALGHGFQRHSVAGDASAMHPFHRCEDVSLGRVQDEALTLQRPPFFIYFYFYFFIFYFFIE
jgi:hypothetical protein